MKEQDIQKTETRNGSKKAIALLAAVFLLGTITGIGGSVMVTVHRLKQNLRNPELAEGPANRVLERIGDDLNRHLDLSAEEDAAVREELEKSHDQLLDIRVRLLHDIRSVSGETVDRIASRLPAEKAGALRQRARERLEPWGLQPEP